MSESVREIGPTTQAVLKETKRITPDGTDEVRHLTLQVQAPAFLFEEGQSIGVVVPGPHPLGNPFHLRRYSIANARSLPLDEGIDLEMLVRRCFYLDEVSGERMPGIGYSADSGHRFRAKPATRSEGFRPPVPKDSGRAFRLKSAALRIHPSRMLAL